MSALLVVLGAALGAPTRYLLDRAVQSRHGTPFPWGTLSVNVVGSLILGLLTGASLAGAAPHDLTTLLGVGFCGALTTYSTFSHETFRLVETGELFHAVANVTVSLVGGLGAASLGVLAATSIWG